MVPKLVATAKSLLGDGRVPTPVASNTKLSPAPGATSPTQLAAVVPLSSTTKLRVPEALKSTLPLLSEPGPLLPGATAPPEAVEVIVPTVPVPPTVPPLMLTALALCEPLTSSVPALTVVVPV